MKKITILGTASAVPDKLHQNTHFIIESDSTVILVDCPGNPFVRLNEAGVDPLTITDLVLTHFHPDHISGLPLLLMDLWLIQKKDPLNIYGLPEVLEKCKKMMALYSWKDWKEFYPINFHEVSEQGISTLIDCNDVKLQAVPVYHLIPTIGIKAIFIEGTFCYSGDTEPCDSVIQLAKDCDILIHEATGTQTGHSSAADAGKIAQAAGVDNLFLIHYPLDMDRHKMVEAAKEHFSGDIVVAEDLMVIEIY